MNKKILFTLLSVMFFLNSSRAQFLQQWATCFNGAASSGELEYAMTIDSSGNVYVTGYSANSNFNSDFGTVKYNNAGVQQWSAVYAASGNLDDFGKAIAVDLSGNVYVCGVINNGGGNSNYATIKYNSSGQQQWVSFYNGTANSNDQANAIAVDAMGNVYVTGFTHNTGTDDYTTIKYNTNGVQQWATNYNGIGGHDDHATAIAIDTTGNVYVTGYAGNVTNADYATVKYNPAGLELWASIYNGTANGTDRATTMVMDKSNNLFVTGYITNSAGNTDYGTIKYNSSGVLQWGPKIYNGSGNAQDQATDVALDTNGNVYVTGYAWETGSTNDYATVKYDAAGTQKWVAYFNGAANNSDKGQSVAVDGEGYVYVTGYSNNISSGTPEFVTVMYDSVGSQLGFDVNNGTGLGQNQGTSIEVDIVGNVYVSGTCSNSIGGYDYRTIKYFHNPLGIFSESLPAFFSVFPNPSTGIFKLGPGYPDSDLIIYNLFGETIFKKHINNHEDEIDLSDKPNGIYFVTIKTNQNSFTQKIIVQK